MARRERSAFFASDNLLINKKRPTGSTSRKKTTVTMSSKQLGVKKRVYNRRLTDAFSNAGMFSPISSDVSSAFGVADSHFPTKKRHLLIGDGAMLCE